MVTKLVAWMAQKKEQPTIKAVRRTLVMIFPFVLLGSFMQILAQSVFSQIGFLNSIFQLSDKVPAFEKIYYFFTNLSFFTLGISALLAAYQVANYQAKYLHKDGAHGCDCGAGSVEPALPGRSLLGFPVSHGCVQ